MVYLPTISYAKSTIHVGTYMVNLPYTMDPNHGIGRFRGPGANPSSGISSTTNKHYLEMVPPKQLNTSTSVVIDVIECL